MKRALVVGGGGSVGVAWQVGLLAGLMDGGVDARDADLILGTSAGAYVGASIAHATDPREMLRTLRAPAAEADQRERPAPDVESLREIWGMLADEERPMTPERRRRVGALALAAKTMSEDDWLSGYSAAAWDGWPAKPFLSCAVDCVSGERRAFDAASGASIERAVAASCAVPGSFPPVTIDGARYADGAIVSWASAELAASIEPDIVLIGAVCGPLTDRPLHRVAAAQIAAERVVLEAAGASVRVIYFDAASIEASGNISMMDATKRVPTADAGEAQGRRLADELRAWWGGG